MKKPVKIILAAAVAVVAFAAAVPLSAMSGDELALAVRDRDTGESAHALVNMELIDKNGNISARIMETWITDDESDNAKMLMVFHTPASIKNTRFLVLENTGKEDDKWIYLPALKKVRRIASSEGSSSFLGTDFTYDDMSTREIDEDMHELLSDEVFNNEECHLLKSVPKDASSSQYSMRKSWIIKNSLVPAKIELYDKKGNLLKVMTADKIEKIQGYPTVMLTTMKNVQTGHATRLEMKKLVYNEKINPGLFTTNFLASGRP